MVRVTQKTWTSADIKCKRTHKFGESVFCMGKVCEVLAYVAGAYKEEMLWWACWKMPANSDTAQRLRRLSYELDRRYKHSNPRYISYLFPNLVVFRLRILYTETELRIMKPIFLLYKVTVLQLYWDYFCSFYFILFLPIANYIKHSVFSYISLQISLHIFATSWRL